MTRAVNRAKPATQLKLPEEAMAHVAIDTASNRGTSRRTKRLRTRRDVIAALAPSTTITLKMLEPSTLLTAIESPPELP